MLQNKINSKLHTRVECHWAQGCGRAVGRSVAAVSIHMCVVEHVNSRLHPSIRSYKGLADQLLRREHTCVSQNKATQRCCKRTHTHTRVYVAGKSILAWFCRPSPAVRTHTCLLQHKSNAGCIQGSTVSIARVWPTKGCCDNTHVHR